MTQGNFAPPASLLATSGPPLGPKPRPAGGDSFQVVSAFCSSTTTITATSQPGDDIIGATVTLGAAGLWVITAFIYFEVAVAGTGRADGLLVVGGVTQQRRVILDEAAVQATPGQQWVVSTTSPSVVAKLTAFKSLAGGTLRANATQTTITALRYPTRPGFLTGQ